MKPWRLPDAFRRSEFVGLDVVDLDFRAQGVVVTLRTSITSHEGQQIKTETTEGGGGPKDGKPEFTHIRIVNVISMSLS